MATDLFGRGMDIERVNIVFNYDMPENSDTYLHRVRRTRGGGWLSMFDCELSSSLKLCPSSRWLGLVDSGPRV